MTGPDPILAHGVGTVYTLPLPLGAYLGGAAATVLVSFLIRAAARTTRPLPDERVIARGGAVRYPILVLRAAALVGLLLTLISGLVVRGIGFTFTTLAFWVGLIVGTTALSAVVAGTWEAVDPWGTTERFYRLEDTEIAERTVPWWITPTLVYLLFWFELVSGVGFDSFWVVVAVIGYTLFSFTLRASLGERWSMTDPLSVLFGFAGAAAPLRVEGDRLLYKGVLRGLEHEDPMPRALFASVFVLLASTTFDNLSETVGWSEFIRDAGLDSLPGILVESVALLALTLPFLITFMAAVAASRRWFGATHVWTIGRHFGWSLVPIGVAYVLAHNAPLLLTGAPQLLAMLSDPFERGWNLLGTAGVASGYTPSAKLVWFLEIAIIVGGHVVAVLAAHRTAVRLAPDHAAAVRSQYALTVLMSVYTIATLWLLAQAVVA